MEQNVRECISCHRRLADGYEYNICPACKEEKLFAQVREYIRSHDVNEYMVANEFQIPIRKVRNWIKEGRIEYVEGNTRIVGTQCQRCGKPVTFGTLCPDCMRLLNYSTKKIQLVGDKTKKGDDKMRFLDS